jgi:hypothetical protein
MNMNRSSKIGYFAGLVIVAVSSQAFGFFPDGPGGPSQPCYANTSKDCANMHANLTRVCTSGSNAIPCGDVILTTSSVSDIKAAASGQAGQTGLTMPCGTGNATIDVYECSGGVCNLQYAAKAFTCQGRCTSGAACTG